MGPVLRIATGSGAERREGLKSSIGKQSTGKDWDRNGEIVDK